MRKQGHVGRQGHCVPDGLRCDTVFGVGRGFDGALGADGKPFLLGKRSVAAEGVR